MGKIRFTFMLHCFIQWKDKPQSILFCDFVYWILLAAGICNKKALAIKSIATLYTTMQTKYSMN